MGRYEYKTIVLKAKGFGVVSAQSVPDLEEALNKHAAIGWRLCEIIPPSMGGLEKVVVVMEREVTMA